MKINKRRLSSKKSFSYWGWIVLAIVLVLIAGVFIFQRPKQTASQPDEINVTQAAQLRDQGAFILDVREPSEWTQFHIPGATLIPLGDLPNRINDVPKDRLVIVVCRTGHRSAQGRDILLKAGFTRVTSMAGGMTEWQTQGQQVISGQ